MVERKLVKISWMPDYDNVRSYMRVMDGRNPDERKLMQEAIAAFAQTANPPVDWTNPDTWLNQLSDGVGKNLAIELWQKSSQCINPYKLGAEINLIKSYHLMIVENEVCKITSEGKLFLREPEGYVVTEIDRIEGIEIILTDLILKGVSKSSALSEQFMKFLAENIESIPKASYQYLLSRLQNLVGRGYVNNLGNFYDISTSGRRYLEKIAPQSQLKLISSDIENQNLATKKALREKLLKLNPFDVEAIIAELFRRMGYKNVIDTPPTRDGGADVIADYDFGFGDEKVVIQVKRYKGGLDRSVVSQLRDDMRSFDNATRGIIVTTGTFNPDAVERAIEAGEVPISLIDGEELIRLMVEYELGIKKEQITYLEFVENDLVKYSTKSPDEI